MPENFNTMLAGNDPKFGKGIECAKAEDLEGVLNVQNSLIIDRNRLSSLNTEETQSLAESGFLIYKTSKEELEGVISDPDHHIFLVVKDGNRVFGYILAYNLNSWISAKPEWKKGLLLSDNPPPIFEQPTLYVRQIGVLSRGHGYGLRLENNISTEAKQRGYRYMIGDILSKPVTNIKSIEYHHKKGFKDIGTVQDQELLWTLVGKEL